MRIIVVFVFLLVNYSAWTQRQFPEWNFKVNDHESNLILFENYSNTLEIDGKKASKMTISSEKANIQSIGDKFIIVPFDGEKEIPILFSYYKRKKKIDLGVMMFHVEHY